MADNMSPEQRSATMSRIRSKNTQMELQVRRLLHRRGYRYRVHAEWLPGKPDIVFTKQQVAVFLDGDFWHGHRFEEWSHKLAPRWREKIERNRCRDRDRRMELQGQGWTVVRIWEHEVEEDLEGCVDRIAEVVLGRRTTDTA